METTQIITRIDKLLSDYNEMRAHSQYDDLSDIKVEGKKDKFITQAITTIEAIAPPNSGYLNRAKYKTAEGNYFANNISILLGVLQALKEDYSSGYLRTLEQLIHADVFSDFLDMANYLLSEGYKDPAAVLIGGVLEEHVRKMCISNGISTTQNQQGKTSPKKTSLMNDDLMKVNVYNALNHKQIIAWLDLRNNAAHGKYSAYNDQQVKMLLEGVMNFISRYPA